MKTLDENDKHLNFLPLHIATVPPKGLIEHIKDKWWSVHPSKGAVFYGQSPQCNDNESITKRLGAMYPWAETRFIPSVFRKINPHDYI